MLTSMKIMLDYLSIKDHYQKHRLSLLIIRYIGSILDYVEATNIYDWNKYCAMMIDDALVNYAITHIISKQQFISQPICQSSAKNTLIKPTVKIVESTNQIAQTQGLSGKWLKNSVTNAVSEIMEGSSERKLSETEPVFIAIVIALRFDIIDQEPGLIDLIDEQFDYFYPQANRFKCLKEQFQATKEFETACEMLFKEFREKSKNEPGLTGWRFLEEKLYDAKKMMEEIRKKIISDDF